MGRKVGGASSVKVTVPVSTVIEQNKYYLLDGFLGRSVQAVTTDAATTGEVILDIEPAEIETSQIDAADAFAVADRVYWDATNKRFTTVATDGIFCGIVIEAKDANDVICFWFAPQQPAFKRAAAVAAVAAADGADAAGAAPTKAEFDAVVALANENKAKLNAVIAAIKAAALMAN